MIEIMAARNSKESICQICLNLDFDHLPKKDQPCSLDEHMITTNFAELKTSAETGDCLPCQIICTGLQTMKEEWDELWINLRCGHSLRITLGNAESEQIVEFYTLSEEGNASIPAFGVGRAVESEMDLGKCLELATLWKKKCDEEHEFCKKTDELRLPTRVIDVGIDEKSDTVHLKETREADRDPYMSLSHCWGLEQIITTTTKTLQERKAGIKLSDLSKTFRDAVKITRGLGIRYLWIDSLCIIQDDMKDWEVESAKMADVYMNSQLNIAATHSSSGKGGCFAERWSLDTLNQVELNVGDDIWIESDADEEVKYKIYIWNALHVAHDHFTRSMDYTNTMELASPLLSRAWVFQERLLSVRTLHFHAEELIWECGSGVSCECSRLEDYQGGDPDGLLQDNESEQLKMIYTWITSSKATESQILEIWLELVREYCSLKLTKQIDRLTALSGLASRVATRLPGEYLAGLWSQDLPRALCWSRESGYRNKYPTFRDPDAYAPSWSWASIWNNRNDLPFVNYDMVKVHGFVADSRCQVQDWHCLRSRRNPFGLSRDTWLKLRAPLIKATFLAEKVETDTSTLEWARKKNLSNYMRKKRVQNMIKFGQESFEFSPDLLDADLNATDIHHGDSVFCLLLGHSRMTRKELLEQWPAQYLSMATKLNFDEPSNQVPRAYALVLSGSDNEYRRVGLLIHQEGPAWWESAKICEVKIV
ncbi:heterokaryon incompatibility protein-domain-containing protein [Cadophora sp. MPI-SDFR-AT-0126]|nr:heterokaryon incompatibility protein-domain-containing protein [Leotiomycetes sp. MPI-SDFR-AT-0126]